MYLSVLPQRIIQSYEYTDVLHTSPAINSIMLIVGDVAKGTKYMFTTNQVTHTHTGVTVVHVHHKPGNTHTHGSHSGTCSPQTR